MKLSDIHRIGVAGGGTMGFGIAFNFAFWGWGYPTIVYSLRPGKFQGHREFQGHNTNLLALFSWPPWLSL